MKIKLEKEIALYFGEERLCLDDEPLTWWKDNARRFPTMAVLARRYLAVPATSVPSERVFSAAGLLVTKLRSSLTPLHIDACIFLGKNTLLKGMLSQPVSQPSITHSPEDVADEEEDFVLLPFLPALGSDQSDDSDDEL